MKCHICNTEVKTRKNRLPHPCSKCGYDFATQTLPIREVEEAVCNHDWLFVKEIKRGKPEKGVEALKTIGDVIDIEDEKEREKAAKLFDLEFNEQGSKYRCSRCDLTKKVY